MSSIAFPNGSTMQVEKLYSLKNSPEALNMVNKAIVEPGDNSDYVVFKKDDKLMVAIGKSDLFDYDKNVKLGIDKTVKFNFDDQECEAVKVVNRENTSSEYDLNHNLSGAVVTTSLLGGSIGYILGTGLAKNVLSDAGGTKGLIIGAAIGLGMGLWMSSAIKRNDIDSSKQPGMDYLLDQKSITTEQ